MERLTFIGVRAAPATKSALRQDAHQRKVSMGVLAGNIIATHYGLPMIETETDGRFRSGRSKVRKVVLSEEFLRRIQETSVSLMELRSVSKDMDQKTFYKVIMGQPFLATRRNEDGVRAIANRIDHLKAVYRK